MEKQTTPNFELMWSSLSETAKRVAVGTLLIPPSGLDSEFMEQYLKEDASNLVADLQELCDIGLLSKNENLYFINDSLFKEYILRTVVQWQY